MSGATFDPTDWAQLFRRSNSGEDITHSLHPITPTSIPVESTVVTAAPTAVELVDKPPPRKRSRASRRAPTTLLNTDTTNFRAMVQQFTGVPTNTYGFAGGGQQSTGFGYELVSGSGLESTVRPHSPAMIFNQGEEAMHMGYKMLMDHAMNDEKEMHTEFFIDGMSHHGYAFNG